LEKGEKRKGKREGIDDEAENQRGTKDTRWIEACSPKALVKSGTDEPIR